jgi:hypothetical protein
VLHACTGTCKVSSLSCISQPISRQSNLLAIHTNGPVFEVYRKPKLMGNSVDAGWLTANSGCSAFPQAPLYAMLLCDSYLATTMLIAVIRVHAVVYVKWYSI